MWTDITRRHYRRDGLKYASDLTEAEWVLLLGELPVAKRRGRPRSTALRRVVQAIFYILEAGLPMADAAGQLSGTNDDPAVFIYLEGRRNLEAPKPQPVDAGP